MAVPGSPLEPRAAGGNRLLKEGAVLVRHANDVIDALASGGASTLRAPKPPVYTDNSSAPDDFPEEQLISVKRALSYESASIEEIARAANVGITRCAAILVELELSGEAITYAGGLAALAI